MYKFPYGISDFVKIREEEYLYLDQTPKIRDLESSGNELLFVRPGQFGKTLLINMLSAYYDIGQKKTFEQLFSNLFISEKPTEKKNQYMVLKFDFGRIISHGNLKQSFHEHINSSIETFFRNYVTILRKEVRMQEDKSFETLNELLRIAPRSNHKLYIFVDNYDSFLNNLLLNDFEIDIDILQVGEGLLKSFFQILRDHIGKGVEHIFVTGLFPFAAKRLIGGFLKDISQERKFSNLCGFGENDIKKILAKISPVGKLGLSIQSLEFPVQISNSLVSEDISFLRDLVWLSESYLLKIRNIDENIIKQIKEKLNKIGLSLALPEEILRIMQTYYSGYRFTHEMVDKVYNPTFCLYFLEHLQMKGAIPGLIIDHSLKTAMDKLPDIGKTSLSERILYLLLLNNTMEISELIDCCTLKTMMNVESQNEAYIASIMYYSGILTIKQSDVNLIMEIANDVVRKLYLTKFYDTFSLKLPGLGEAQRSFFHKHKVEGICRYIQENFLPNLSKHDYLQINEQTYKLMFLSLLFRDDLFIIDNNPEVLNALSDLYHIGLFTDDTSNNFEESKEVENKNLQRKAYLFFEVRSSGLRYGLSHIMIGFKVLLPEDLGEDWNSLEEKSDEEIWGLRKLVEKEYEAKCELKTYETVISEKFSKAKIQKYVLIGLGFERVLGKRVS